MISTSLEFAAALPRARKALSLSLRRVRSVCLGFGLRSSCALIWGLPRRYANAARRAKFSRHPGLIAAPGRISARSFPEAIYCQ